MSSAKPNPDDFFGPASGKAEPPKVEVAAVQPVLSDPSANDGMDINEAGRASVSPARQAARDVESRKIIVAELETTQARAAAGDQRAASDAEALKRELARLDGQAVPSGLSVSRPGLSSAKAGKTTKGQPNPEDYFGPPAVEAAPKEPQPTLMQRAGSALSGLFEAKPRDQNATPREVAPTEPIVAGAPDTSRPKSLASTLIDESRRTPDQVARNDFAATDPRRLDIIAPGMSVLDRPTAEFGDRLRREREIDSNSPQRIEQLRQQSLQDAAASRPMAQAKPFTLEQNIAADVRGMTSNPVARGAVAGFSELGKTGTGAVRLAADLFGADEVARFAKGAEGKAETIGSDVTRDLKGNAKLISDITSSIVVSAPTMVVGMFGGPALRSLFVQSALSEYGNGRDAGFGVGESLSRAGIYGFAEALGERFGFAQQIKLLKSITKTLPTHELAKTLGEMISKEIPGEQLTTLMEFIADKGGPAALHPNSTMADYLNAMGETLKVTIGQSLVMGGGPTMLSSVRNELAKADATTTRPTEMKAQTLQALDDIAVTAGIPPAAVSAIKKAADGVPLAEVPGFIKRAVTALDKRGLVKGQIDAAALERIEPTLDAAAPAEQPAVDAETAAKPAPAAPTETSQAEDDYTGLSESKPIAGQPINRNWTAFSSDSGTLGIPREQMPQIDSEHRGALVNFLNARGVEHLHDQVLPKDLKPTQAEFSPQKVKTASEFSGGDRSILVSSDNYILDGTHQWLAKLDEGSQIDVLRLNAPIQDLLRLAHQFPSSTTSGGARRSHIGGGSANQAQPVSAHSLQDVEERQGSVPQSQQSVLPQLRWQGNISAPDMGPELQGVSGRSRGAPVADALSGQDRQQRQLLPGQRALADEEAAGLQHEEKPQPDAERKNQGADRVGRGVGVGSINAAVPTQTRSNVGGGGADNGASRRKTAGSAGVADGRNPGVDESPAAVGGTGDVGRAQPAGGDGVGASAPAAPEPVGAPTGTPAPGGGPVAAVADANRADAALTSLTSLTSGNLDSRIEAFADAAKSDGSTRTANRMEDAVRAYRGGTDMQAAADAMRRAAKGAKPEIAQAARKLADDILAQHDRDKAQVFKVGDLVHQTRNGSGNSFIAAGPRADGMYLVTIGKGGLGWVRTEHLAPGSDSNMPAPHRALQDDVDEVLAEDVPQASPGSTSKSESAPLEGAKHGDQKEDGQKGRLLKPGGGAAGGAAPAKPKVYKTKAAAVAARKELGNTHRVQKVKGGFMLRQATEKELAAVEAAGKRLSGPKAVDIENDSLLAAISKLGGLDASERSDTVGTGNVNVGGGMLFRKDGRSIDDLASGPLAELGYIPQHEIERDGGTSWLRDAISSEFMGTRRHFSERGQDWMERAQAERDAQQDDGVVDIPVDNALADFTPDDLEEAGYTALDPQLQAATEALLSEAQALGIDTELVIDDAVRLSYDQPEAYYHAQLQRLAREAIAAARQQARGADAQAARGGDQGGGQAAGVAQQEQDQAQGVAPGLELQAHTQDELRAKAEREQAALDADRKKKAAEQERLRREAESRDAKRRADQTVDDFQLGQSAEQQLSGMGDLFAQPSESNPSEGSQGAAAKIGDEEAFADNFSRFDGKDLVQQIMVGVDGKTVKLKMDAGSAMRAAQSRLDALRALRACIGSG